MVDAVELPLVDTRECSIPVEDSPPHSFSLVPSAVQCNHMDCVGVTHRISSQRRVSASTGRKIPWPTRFPEHHRTRLPTFFSQSGRDSCSTSFLAPLFQRWGRS